MHMTDLIEKKKRKNRSDSHAGGTAFYIVHGFTRRGDIPDYQMSALMMAIYFRGMTPEEAAPGSP